MNFFTLSQYKQSQTQNVGSHGRRTVILRRTAILRCAVVLGMALSIGSIGGVQPVFATDNTSSQSTISHNFDAPSVLQIQAANNVDDTVAALTEMLILHRFKIELVVNHMAAANSVNLDLRPTQVIYAQPPEAVVSKLREESASVFIDLPLKYLVFEDENGEIQIRSNTVGYLIDRHALPTKYWPLQFTDHINSLLDPPDTGLVSIRSRLPLNEAYSAIKAAIVATGAFRIPLELQFGSGSARQRLLVFGNPNVGTPLMQQDQNIGLDLPQEILVGGDGKGGSIITYNDPFFIAARYGIVGEDQRLGMISNALGNFAGAGAPN